jgi:hypothetical protein
MTSEENESLRRINQALDVLSARFSVQGFILEVLTATVLAKMDSADAIVWKVNFLEVSKRLVFDDGLKSHLHQRQANIFHVSQRFFDEFIEKVGERETQIRAGLKSGLSGEPEGDSKSPGN